MTAEAMIALEQEVRSTRELIATLTPAEWASDSACDGWRVQDLVQHMAAVFQQIADASSIDTGDSGRAEASNEVPVQARREWTIDRVIGAYEEWAPKGVAALGALQEAPMADMEVPIADLGTHPLRLLANAIAFDHYCHLRHDLPHIERAALLPQDEATLGVVLEWMLAGLPQMCAEALAAAPRQTVNLVFDGPGGGSYVLAPGEGEWTVTTGSVAEAPTVHTTVHDFVSWGTKRSDWRSTATGDVSADGVAEVLDAINII
jgi:uncharacterized protein (TIGR03083 family)